MLFSWLELLDDRIWSPSGTLPSTHVSFERLFYWSICNLSTQLEFMICFWPLMGTVGASLFKFNFHPWWKSGSGRVKYKKFSHNDSKSHLFISEQGRLNAVTSIQADSRHSVVTPGVDFWGHSQTEMSYIHRSNYQRLRLCHVHVDEVRLSLNCDHQ
jgi:hypothetical protein